MIYMCYLLFCGEHLLLSWFKGNVYLGIIEVRSDVKSDPPKKVPQMGGLSLVCLDNKQSQETQAMCQNTGTLHIAVLHLVAPKKHSKTGTEPSTTRSNLAPDGHARTHFLSGLWTCQSPK